MEAATRSVNQSAPAPTIKVILWALIFLAAMEFTVRGPARYLQASNWNDLSQNYVASKVWLKGQSPADPETFVATWKQQTGSRLDLDDIRTHLAPPPGGLVVLAPVAALPWKIAEVVWLALLLISFAATVWALASIAGFHWNESRTLVFIATCLALAPFQTDIASGNSSIFVIALCVLAIWFARHNRNIASGILFGIACALKPQLGAFLVLYYLVRRRWKLFATAVACTLTLNLAAVLYLQIRGASWIQDYAHNARGFVTSNHIDDFTTENPARFTLINLQVPFFSITGRSSSANLLAFAVVILLVCLWIYFVARKGEHALELLSLATISVIALLPVYHRFYDAALLTVPLAWSIAHAAYSSRTIARLSLLLTTPFLFPGAALLEQLAAHGRVGDTITQSWWWSTIVMPHETWSLLLLSLILLYAMNAAQTGERSFELAA
jgi:hypothetical protein